MTTFGNMSAGGLDAIILTSCQPGKIFVVFFHDTAKLGYFWQWTG
jgi:hypothetical protein